MNLFEEIVNESSLLTEGVAPNNVINAINGMHPVWITYNDEQGGGGKGRRLIYPIAYGLTSGKEPKPVVRAFEPTGSSKRGLTTPPNNRKYPKWKYFRLDRIQFWRTVNSKVYDPEEMEGYEDGIVNTEGDRSMSAVYAIAPIGNAKNIKRQETEKPETNNQSDISNTPTTDTSSFEPRPITKDEVEGIDVEPIEQPIGNNRKLTAKGAIDSIIGWIKKYGNKAKQGVQKLFGKKLENNSENNNIKKVDTINAPNTKPVTKQEVGDSINDKPDTGEKQVSKPTDEPVTKQEVENGEENNLKENVLTSSYKDMIDRMNNLYK